MSYMSEKRVNDFVEALVTEGSFKHLDLLSRRLQESPAILAYLLDHIGTHSEKPATPADAVLETVAASHGG